MFEKKSLNATAQSPVEIDKNEFPIDTNATAQEKIITPQDPNDNYYLYRNLSS